MDPRSQQEATSARREGIRPQELVERGLLYVGLPAVTLYPLGFVALGVQLWRDPAFPYRDFTTVWEAAGLIPQTVVVATGIRLIYISLVATLVGAVIAWGLLSLARRWRKGPGYGDEGSMGVPPRSRGLWSVVLLLLLPLAVVSFLIWGDPPFDDRPDNDLLYVTGFVLLSIVAGALLDYAWARRHGNWFVPSLAAAYVTAIVAALCFTATQTPALSLVRIDVPVGGVEEAEACSEGITGNVYVKLEEGLSHWHLYNREGLFAIPDEEVDYVEYEHCSRLLNRN